MNVQSCLLDYLTVIQFSGADSENFLQSQLTADLRELHESGTVFACACNPAGRVLGLMLLRRTSDDEILALCSKSLASSLRAHLSRFVLRAKVSISVRDDLVVEGLREPGEVLDDSLVFESPGGAYRLRSGAECEGPGPDAASVAEWRARELAQGVHWLDENTSERFLPQMLGFERIGALSFSKGCYPGQEVIARTRHLGKLKRHPLACQLDQHVNVQPLTDTMLSDGESEASAVLIQGVNLEDGHAMVMLVARIPQGFSPRSCFIGQAPYGIEWFGTPDPSVRLP